jgi:adenylate kinase family enzyme
MKRILIIGPGGSGKSTLSRALGQKLGLEVLHLDKFYWGKGWIKPAPDDWQKTVSQLLARDAWIIDGNYSGTLSQRIEACDTIVFLDLSTLVCMWRVTKRWLFYRRVTRPDMAEACDEKLDLEFMNWVLGYSRRSRPKVVKLIQENRTTKKIVWLKSSKDVDRFINSTACYEQ